MLAQASHRTVRPGRKAETVEQALRQLAQMRANLAALGARRLAILGVVGALVAALTTGAAWLASRPSWETLYVGLDRQDVGRIGATLREAGIAFDTSADGATVYVKYGATAQARMLLAERGLPHGASGGYELFDKLGSLGLTSFMQEVTRIRAIEGELARTIQLIRGVKAARVHIVAADEGSFRRAKQAASASVVIRTDGGADQSAAAAIRKLVAAAVPGMTGDQVTVLSSEGVILAAGEDAAEAGPTRLRQLETSVANEARDNIRRTLSPLLGAHNLQVSVAARLNADKRQTDETIFNPDSKVERSVRVIKESQNSQNASQSQATTVERNLPSDRARAGDGRQSTEENQKREELTNFELSSKRVSTTSAGYAIEQLSAAVVVNRASLASVRANAAPEAIEAELKDLEALVASAAGLRRDRGDIVKVSAIDFSAADPQTAAPAGFSPVDLLARHAGALVSAGAGLAIALLVLTMGVKPLTRALMAPPPAPAAPAVEAPAIAIAPMPSPETPAIAIGIGAEPAVTLEPPRRIAQRKLEQIVDLDEDLAAEILRQWVREEQAA
ncbi:MAG: flagellar M-ring protein FliF [Methylobacteriaceae bacterium]|nr:flagellar M-ring protein FliF [Methylobacteriaceae bacterium]